MRLAGVRQKRDETVFRIHYVEKKYFQQNVKKRIALHLIPYNEWIRSNDSLSLNNYKQLMDPCFRN